MNEPSVNTEHLDPTSVSPEAYLAWVRTKMQEQDRLLAELMAPLMGMDVNVAVSEQWLEDLAEVAGAFVEPDPEQATEMAFAFRV